MSYIVNYHRLLLTLVIVILTGSAPGQEKSPPPWVKIPTILRPSLPTPPPIADIVPRLNADELYVLDCSEPCFLLVSPSGTVAVTQHTGPIRIRGKFVGGSGKYETKTFAGKTVFEVEAVGTGRVELIVIKEGAKSATDVFRQRIDVNVGPLPPPTPPVPPDPPKPEPPKPDPPSPVPIPAPGLRVLIVYESRDLHKLTAGHREIMYGAKVRNYMSSVCVAGPDGKTPEWRVYDQNVVTAGESKLWQEAMRRERKSLPWLVISNPAKGGYEGLLPGSADAFLTLLKQYE